MWTCQHHCKLISLIYFTVLQLDIENLEIQDQRTVVEDSILSSSFLLFHHLETYSKIKLRNKKPNHAHITITVRKRKKKPTTSPPPSIQEYSVKNLPQAMPGSLVIICPKSLRLQIWWAFNRMKDYEIVGLLFFGFIQA